MIIGTNSKQNPQSVVFTEKRQELVTMTPDGVAAHSISHQYKLEPKEYPAFLTAVSQIFGATNGHKLPVMTKDYSLVPLRGRNAPNQILINPAHVYQSTAISNKKIALQTTFGFNPIFPISQWSLQNQMKRGLIAQAVAKREALPEECLAHDSLQSFLNLYGTPEVRKVLSGLKTSDIPGVYGEFFENLKGAAYELYFQERLAQDKEATLNWEPPENAC